jgi:hypothetical protein
VMMCLTDVLVCTAGCFVCAVRHHSIPGWLCSLRRLQDEGWLGLQRAGLVRVWPSDRLDVRQQRSKRRHTRQCLLRAMSRWQLRST